MCTGLMCGRGHYCACSGPVVFSGGGANSDMMCSETVETVSDKQDTDQNKYGESESGVRQCVHGVVISGCQKKMDRSYVFFSEVGTNFTEKKNWGYLGIPLFLSRIL